MTKAMVLVTITLVLIMSLPIFRFPQMRRMAWRNLWLHRKTTILTVLGSMVGTALITSALLLQTSLTDSLDRFMAEQFGPITHEIVGVQEKSNYKYPFEQAEIDVIKQKITQNAVFKDLLPVVSFYSTMVKENEQGKAILIQPNIHIQGVDYEQAKKFDPVGASLFPQSMAKDEVVLSDRTAKLLGVHKGDTILVVNQEKSYRLKVLEVIDEQGITGYRGAKAGVATAFINEQKAREMAGISKGYSSIYVSQIPDSTDTNMSLFGPDETGFRESLVRFMSENKASGISKFLPFFNLAALVAILVGIVLVVNLFRMIADERMKELGILRSVGFSRMDLRRILRLEGFFYALLSSLMGVFCGIGIAQLAVGQLSEVMELSLLYESQIYMRYEFHMEIVVLLIGFIIGFSLIYLSMVLISWNFSKTNIIAMLDDVRVQSKELLTPVITKKRIGISIVLLGLLISLVCLLPTDQFQKWVAQSGDVGTLINVCLILVVTLTVFSFLMVGLPVVLKGLHKTTITFPRMYGMLGMSFRYPLTNKKRTSLILFMFTVVLFLSGFSGIVRSGLGQFTHTFDSRQALAGYELSASADGFIKSDQLKALFANPRYFNKTDIKSYSVIYLFDPRESNFFVTDNQVNGIDSSFADYNQLALTQRASQFQSDRETWRELAKNKDVVIISDSTAKLTKDGKTVKVGDQVPVSVGKQIVTKKVIGIARYKNEYYGFPTSYGIWMNQQELLAHAPNTGLISSYVLTQLQESKQLPIISTELKKDFSLHGIYQIQNPQVIFEAQQSFMKILLSLFQVFSNLATVIGIFGLTALMYRLIRERRQQIGMLRALGISRRIIYWGIIWEGAVIAVLGITAGIGLGAFVGDFMLTLLFEGSKDLNHIQIPVDQLFWTWTGALLLTILTSMIPARQSFKLTPAEATRYFD